MTRTTAKPVDVMRHVVRHGDQIRVNISVQSGNLNTYQSQEKIYHSQLMVKLPSIPIDPFDSLSFDSERQLPEEDLFGILRRPPP